MKYLVVGGTSGIGAETVRLLAGIEGATVVFSGRNEEAAAEVAASLEPDRRRRAVFVRADVARRDDMDALFERVRALPGDLRGAFNAAGVADGGGPLHGTPSHEAGEEGFDRVVEVNLKGAWRSLCGELAIMAAQGSGSIVNCSSVAGLRTADSLSAPYTASKHALIGLTRSLAVEYAPHGVRVNAVCPGVIDTPMLGGMREELLADLHRKNPAARIGTPAEVAESVLFLLSDRSRYISGTTLTVDAGGLTGAL
ncbi:SDR family NAD(P)-dependent oxidoreductase [Nocardiopsis potens]|uniref:SDR family NAD(P)-dependent oxidoreductase n=1 Tax=Nocardiopsis potens TaxID=1246458 RepID=UPI00034DC1ED|nr:SDR family oxidoreductase [Nocardiopsis potens]